MMRALPYAVLLALALPGVAHAQLPDDVARVHAAVVELSQAKQALARKADRARRAGRRALADCRERGPGWQRIRSVRDASQRAAYARGARKLWRDLDEAAPLGRVAAVYSPAWRRILDRLDAPFADPVIQAGADALRGRIAYVRGAYSFASCRTFERLLRGVREFRVGGRHRVSGDYRAGRIHNQFVSYVARRQRRLDARHGGRTARARLESARERIVALGGDFGYASYFIAAHSLNR